MDKLIVLGTAGDVEVLASQKRAAGGLILHLDTYQFHLDPGPGSLPNAKAAGISPRETIAILSSNASLLRSNDVKATVAAMTLNGIDRHGVLLAAASVIDTTPDFYKKCVEGAVPLTPQSKVGINSINIFPIKTLGVDQQGIGFRLESDRQIIGYTGDTSYYETIANDYKGCTVLIMNVRHPATTKEEGFLNIEDADLLINQVKPKLAIITGFGSKIKDQREIARELQRKSKVQIVAAEDGLKLELPR